jgi:hypothetical protein
VRHASARAVPVDYQSGSPATAGLWRAEVRADTPAGPLDQVFFVKLLRHPRLWPQLGQLPDEAARQDFVAYFPWRFELDMHDCGIADVLPPGMRAPVLYRAKHVDADHIALWWEYVNQRPGPWALADYHRAARLLGRLAARRRAGAAVNRRLPEIARRQRPGEVLRYFVTRRVEEGCLPADLAALGARLPALLDRLDRCRSATPTATRARRTCSSRRIARPSSSSSTGGSGPRSRWASTSGSC